MAFAEYTQITDILKTTISKVANTGIIHGYQRNINDPEKFKTLCFDKENSRISSWMISRESMGDIQASNIANTRVHSYVLRGYMGVNDDNQTELIFQKSIDAIADAFTPQGSLGSTVELIRPVQARQVAFVELHGVLCHYAELTIDVQEHQSS